MDHMTQQAWSIGKPRDNLPRRRDGIGARIADGLERIGDAMSYVAIAIVTFLMLPIAYDVTARTSGHPTYWGFDVTMYLLITGSFLATAWALKHGNHFRVITVLHFFPRAKRAMDRFAYAMTLLFGIVVVIGGSMMSWESFANDIRAASILDIQLYIPQLTIPLGGLVLCLQALATLIRDEFPEHHEVM